jgi:hypothetical protein
MYRLFRARRWVASGIMLSILMMNVMSYGGPLLDTAEARGNGTNTEYDKLVKDYKDCMKRKEKNPKFNTNCAFGISVFKEKNPQLKHLWTSSGTRTTSSPQNLAEYSFNPSPVKFNIPVKLNIPKTNAIALDLIKSIDKIRTSNISTSEISKSGNSKIFEIPTSRTKTAINSQGIFSTFGVLSKKLESYLKTEFNQIGSKPTNMFTPVSISTNTIPVTELL